MNPNIYQKAKRMNQNISEAKRMNPIRSKKDEYISEVKRMNPNI